MRTLNLAAFILLACAACFGQQPPPPRAERTCNFGTGTTPSWSGLTAGKSTRDDVERVLGQPVNRVSETLVEYKANYPLTNVYVQYRKGSSVVERIELQLTDTRKMSHSVPSTKGIVPDAIWPLHNADGDRVNSKGRLEGYFGAPEYVVLTYFDDKGTSMYSVYRVAYYSPELFGAVASSIPPSRERRMHDLSMDPQFVQSVQAALKREGFYGGAVDGQLSLNTRAALRTFQRARNIYCYGNIDEDTAHALGLTPPR